MGRSRSKALGKSALLTFHGFLFLIWMAGLCHGYPVSLESSPTYSDMTDLRVGGAVTLFQSINLQFYNNSGSTLSLGHVVVVDGTGNLYVTTTTTEAHPKVIGVVYKGGNHGEWVLVAVGGQFQVWVTGGYNLGDFLMTSSTPGYAKAVSTAQKGVFAIVVSSGTAPGLVFAVPVRAEVY